MLDPSDNCPEERKHDAFRKDPHAPRSDTTAQVILDYPMVFDTICSFMQCETFAGLGPACEKIPAECSQQVRDRKGWILYERPGARLEENPARGKPAPGF